MEKSMVSVVIPVMNELGNIEEVFRRLETAFQDWTRPYEIIFIDDGSTDGTSELLEAYPRKNSHAKIIKFKRNFGQQLALSAGFSEARGDICVCIDADLQVDPLDIPKLVDAIDAGSDMVIGKRQYRSEPLLARRIPSLITNKIFSKFFKVKFEDLGCGLQAFRRKLFKGVPQNSSMFIHLPLFAVWRGASLTHVPVNYSPRLAGETKYNWISLVYYFLDVVITFMSQPAILAYLTIAGMLSIGAGLVGGLINLISGASGLGFSTGAWAVALFCVFSGLVLFLFGLTNEYVRRITARMENAPMYVIDEIIENKEGENETEN